MVFYFYITQYPNIYYNHIILNVNNNADPPPNVHGAMFVFCLVDIFIFCFTKLHPPKIDLDKDFSKFDGYSFFFQVLPTDHLKILCLLILIH